jgi:hypothetical protein
MRTRLSAVIAVTLVLAVGPVLTGCSAVEGIIEQQTGGQVDLGGNTIPNGYPTTEVPLANGDIIFGGSIGNDEGKVFNVTIKVADGNALDSIAAQLEGVGFVSEGAFGGATADGGTYIAKTDKWGVLVVVSKDATNGFVANYTVTSSGAAQ